MKCKWIEIDKFDFENESEFEGYIFLHGEVKKAKWDKKIFSFNFGMCGRKVPTHVMKISIPKPPKTNKI